ncbi:MAG TPA: sulfotransferase family 2 domain-containing protein [Rhizomicrobium sp.]|jgi:hypothetical protein|nr:sulfotransferase family 2 domain-containing protein [Rhizomicrobium sp.]
MSTAPVHFLHVPKTGGCAIRAALEPFADSHGLVFHWHGMSLRKLPEGERAVFFVRHPVTRFVSGFNSRLRRGMPHHEGQHTPKEEIAFARFQTPNMLAEALASADTEARESAEFAMDAISHTRRRITDTVGDSDYIVRRRTDILFFGFQETLAEDFERLKEVLGLSQSITLPDDDVVAHRTPYGFETRLSREGRRAIKGWYRDDLTLYRHLQSLAAMSV